MGKENYIDAMVKYQMGTVKKQSRTLINAEDEIIDRLMKEQLCGVITEDRCRIIIRESLHKLFNEWLEDGESITEFIKECEVDEYFDRLEVNSRTFSDHCIRKFIRERLW